MGLSTVPAEAKNSFPVNNKVVNICEDVHVLPDNSYSARALACRLFFLFTFCGEERAAVLLPFLLPSDRPLPLFLSAGGCVSPLVVYPFAVCEEDAF